MRNIAMIFFGSKDKRPPFAPALRGIHPSLARPVADGSRVRQSWKGSNRVPC